MADIAFVKIQSVGGSAAFVCARCDELPMGKLQTNPTNPSLHWIHWIYPDRVQVMLGLPGSPATDVVLVEAPTSKRS